MAAARRIRTYTEFSDIQGFRDRFDYLRLSAPIGIATFGYDRWINQRFYQSVQWKRMRNQIIARDRGCDLGLEGYEVHDRIAIHHMNPLIVSDLTHMDDSVLDPEYLITVSHRTHNAIHFGDARMLTPPLVVRRPGDTKLW